MANLQLEITTKVTSGRETGAVAPQLADTNVTYFLNKENILNHKLFERRDTGAQFTIEKTDMVNVEVGRWIHVLTTKTNEKNGVTKTKVTLRNADTGEVIRSRGFTGLPRKRALLRFPITDETDPKVRIILESRARSDDSGKLTEDVTWQSTFAEILTQHHFNEEIAPNTQATPIRETIVTRLPHNFIGKVKIGASRILGFGRVTGVKATVIDEQTGDVLDEGEIGTPSFNFGFDNAFNNVAKFTTPGPVGGGNGNGNDGDDQSRCNNITGWEINGKLRKGNVVSLKVEDDVTVKPIQR